MKIVKYKITGAFGMRKVGEVIDAYLLIEDYYALIYHKSNRKRGECGAIEICERKKDRKHGEIYVSVNDTATSDKEIFINLNSESEKLIRKLLK